MAPSELAASFAQAMLELPWEEPADAYAKVRAAGGKPWLLDGLGAHPDARHAYIALDHDLEVRIDGQGIEEHRADGSVEFLDTPPWSYLHRIFAERQPGAQPGFTGGWIGWLGFDLAREAEPMLGATRDDGPLAILRRCASCLVFDRAARTLRVFVADHGGEMERAHARAAELREILVGRAPPAAAAPRVGASWETSLDETAFCQRAEALLERIRDGDLFQANLATRFSTDFEGDPLDVFRRLEMANPSPWMALLEHPHTTIVSSSPEQLLSLADGVLRSRPIAGTRKRGATPAEDDAMETELLTDLKEQAEHTMLVDLVRNDIAIVAKPGTVHVPERMSVERYRHVIHLVSRVEGRTDPALNPAKALAALFPGGTITGAPKLRAIQRILEAEPVPRGPYTGSAGYVAWDGSSQWNILIRTLVLRDGRIHVHAGSGIVADSDPKREWKEANRKAKALLDAATGTATAVGTRLGEVTRHGSWEPPKATKRATHARVLLIDNMDSFVHNLADYCAALGASVKIVRNDDDWRAVADKLRPTHIILSPGPGWPAEAGCSAAAAAYYHGKVPVLGVCLGHQVLGSDAGQVVARHPGGPVHGMTSPIHHDDSTLFRGLPNPFEATRYHSLVVEGVAADWKKTAWLQDGTVMAMQHRSVPTFGVQFHPESLCTPVGLEIIARFLETHA